MKNSLIQNLSISFFLYFVFYVLCFMFSKSTTFFRFYPTNFLYSFLLLLFLFFYNLSVYLYIYFISLFFYLVGTKHSLCFQIELRGALLRSVVLLTVLIIIGTFLIMCNLSHENNVPKINSYI